MRYELFGITPNSGQWRWGRERSLVAIENYKKALFELNETENTVTEKQIDEYYLKQLEDFDLLRLSKTGKPEHYIASTDSTLLNTSWQDLLVGSSSEILDLFDKKVFDTAKLTAVIKRMLGFCNKDSNDIILDFFSGSATTAHAVMQLNAEDGGNRKFILVQIPELCDPKNEAYKAGYKTIADIGKERIRRAGQKIQTDNALAHPDLDIGFRVLKIDSSNMNDVYYRPDQIQQADLLNLVDNIKPDRSGEDLLFQVLLDWGVDLTLPITAKIIDKKTIFYVADNEIIACFDRHGGITENLIQQLTTNKPKRVVFCDAGFADDSVKINVEQIFKSLSPHTEIKTI